MSTKDLVASNEDPKTKKVFKEAELVIRRITQLHLNNPKIEVKLNYWDWEHGVLGDQDDGDPDAYLYCWVDDKTKSKKEIDEIIEKKGEIWTDYLNEFFHENKKKVTINNLLTIGKDIGSDVPACIYSRSLIATGKGENISMCSMPNNKHFLILFPGISISTRNIFQNFDKKKYNDIFVNSFESIKVINSLLPVVSCIEPKIKQILSILKSLNNVQSYGMTGSGSACYAIFNNINDLKNALRMIKIRRKNDWFIWYGKKKEFGFNRFLY